MACPLVLEPNPVIVEPSSSPTVHVSVRLKNTGTAILLLGVSNLDDFTQVSPLCCELPPDDSRPLTLVFPTQRLSSPLPLELRFAAVPAGASQNYISEMMSSPSRWKDSLSSVIRQSSHEELTMAALSSSLKKRRERGQPMPSRSVSDEEQQIEMMERTITAKRQETDELEQKLGALQRDVDVQVERLKKLEDAPKFNTYVAGFALLFFALAFFKRILF